MNIQKKIWDFCRANGFTEAGTAGLMGNIQAESAFNPINLEQAYESKLKQTDRSYTDGVDNATYEKFVSDAAGYGLCQWTYWSRKASLLAFAKDCNASIGDLDMQMRFMISELRKDFPAVYSCLCNAQSVVTASDMVMLDYENPADKSAKAMAYRASLGEAIFDKFTGSLPAKENAPAPAVTYRYSDVALRELAIGRKGVDVESMQTLLAFNVDNELVVDGDFGAHTQAVLIRFQQENGLAADGICGAQTWAKLING